jgi:hypothetical protein
MALCTRDPTPGPLLTGGGGAGGAEAFGAGGLEAVCVAGAGGF